MKSLRPNQPHLIIVVGLPGSGKSFFAEKFSETFNAPYINSEKIMRLAECNDKQASSLIDYQLIELLKTNMSIILEGETDTRTDRMALAKKARDAGYKLLVVWVQTDSFTAKNRTVKSARNKTNRTLTEEEYDKIAKRFTPPNVSEQPVVISGKHTYATQVKIVLKKLSSEHEQAARSTTVPERPVTRGRVINIQ